MSENQIIYCLFQRFVFIVFVDHKEQYAKFMVKLCQNTGAHLKWDGKKLQKFTVGKQTVHIDFKRYLKLQLDLTTFYL